MDDAWPSASVRTYLIAVMLLAIIPIAAILSWQAIALMRADQHRMEDDLQRSTFAFAQAVERELGSSQDALTVLSQSELFQQGRVAALGRLLQGRPRRDWDSIFLVEPNGNVVLDTASPRIAHASVTDLRTLTAQVARTGQPAVSGLIGAQAAWGGGVAMALPVMQGRALRYVLGVRMNEDVWSRLTAGAAVPHGARASLYDAQAHLISDSAAPHAPAGATLPTEAAALTKDTPEGVQRTSDTEGDAVYAAWRTLPGPGWQVRVSTPAGAIDADHTRAVVAALTTSGGSLVLGLLLAAIVARRIAKPLRALAAGGPDGLPGRAPVREVAALRDALRRAHESDLRAREALEERARQLVAVDARLRESRHLMELAQEAGHVGFFHHDFVADRLVWSHGLCTLFGIAALEHGHLRDWFARIAPQHRERVEREFWTACALQRDKVLLEYGVERDGAERWLSSRCTLEYGADGHPQRLAGVTVDMTGQREAENARARETEDAVRAQHQAENASRAKDDFVGMLGHELRNPVGAISAAADVLDAAEPDSPSATEAREIITRQAHRLAHMMNDLLDAGRVIAGRVVLARQPVDLADVVRRAGEALARTGDGQAHPLRLDLHEAWVDADPVRIEQAVSHLLLAATRSSPAGREIRVSCGVLGAQAVLAVRAGVSASQQPHDLSADVERPQDRRAGGPGMGLALLRRLVELHGGTVAEGGPDAGTDFTVRLPAIPAPTQHDAETLPPSRRRKVLVVEDNGDVLAALRSGLELDGHTVSTAVDGVEGLSRLLHLRPEVSIVDIGLPGLTGFELARHARAAGYAGRMIALSGCGQERDAQEALVAGFDAYLVKPVDRDELRASMSAE